MSDDLAPADYAILLLLKIEDREISNTELNELYGVRLLSPAYERLNAGGYVVSRTDRRPYRHSLADKGVRVLARPLALGEEQTEAAERRSGKEKQLWAALAAVHRENLDLRAAGKPGDDTRSQDPRGLDERIRAAYGQVADGPGDWVSLTEIRALLADVAKADLDKALEQLLDAPDVRLEPEVNRHRLGQRERDASLQVGGEERHKLAIGLR
ncbi:unnamed protein product [[Actinomadura] parvosata subsp. kistnae]|uniref:Uncharacterized protein n=1 Tax=[Actinomadura] parvosata subsp. kistnae TaxID=1909395 RepID=A0A1V0A0N8_9ACTN|nr:hypothetical protein [Nonomuraea sp. ATCC 55076]AQZ63732.1 hypothetical protein BKM31_21730 [Nonomuraea sp. ATCC 55076]SPL89534.1 unnamed protein product [Actinomadura parvosata subsp. kistnae]